MAQRGRPPKRAPRLRTPVMSAGAPTNQGSTPTNQGSPQGPQLVWLDPRVIFWPEVRITSQYRGAEADALSRSIEGVGQQQPIGVTLVDGKYVGSDGMNRCLRAIERGEASVMCVVRQGTAADVLLANIATALLRGHTNPLSEVETLWKAYHEEGVEIADLAMSAGHPVDWVERRLLIATASPAVKQCLGDELIQVGIAELLAALEEHADQEAALALVVQHRWTVAELEAHLAGRTPGEEDGEGESPREAKAARIPRACTVCHQTQEVGGVQSMLVCPGCMEGIAAYSQAGVDRAANEDARLALAVRGMVGALREAEAALAGSPGTVGLAEQIARLVELAGAGVGGDG